MSSSLFLFDDVWQITARDPEGKKFDKVSRYVGKTTKFEMDVILDVNIEIYPMEVGESYRTCLATTLSPDGTADEGIFDQSGKISLADDFEYVMYGKLYKVNLGKGANAKEEIYISFGGLLMMLKGHSENLRNLEPDKRLYLLIRKA
eukprot:TRINITY_DN14905_c0_g2_i1.p1 TRINITY_DN14905_c0_g2~~TRINITY_DN14905_c0_g2_i1.p1  ORF type:complete len:147 (+),score=32.57 TRINITY_DN14905_c0_g2_i1:36-476(+)